MIGDALRRIRTIYDYKASDLSAMLGISSSYLSEIENNKKTPSLELLSKYADVFDIKLSALMLLSEGDLGGDVSGASHAIGRKLAQHLIEYLSKGVDGVGRDGGTEK